MLIIDDRDIDLSSHREAYKYVHLTVVQIYNLGTASSNIYGENSIRLHDRTLLVDGNAHFKVLRANGACANVYGFIRRTIQLLNK